MKQIILGDAWEKSNTWEKKVPSKQNLQGGAHEETPPKNVYGHI